MMKMIMFRKIKKIIEMRNKAPNPIFVKCYLESEKNYKHIKDKDAYVAIITSDIEKNAFKYFFTKGRPKLWNPKHKTYWMIFNFNAQIGDIIEFRGSSNMNREKKYYIVGPGKKYNNLLEIPKRDAFRIVILRDEQDIETHEYHLRTIPAAVKSYVWHRDGQRCVYCGSNENLEYDHIIPFSWGGSNSPENVQLLCRTCNRRKSDNLNYGKTRSMILNHLKNQSKKKFAS